MNTKKLFNVTFAVVEISNEDHRCMEKPRMSQMHSAVFTQFVRTLKANVFRVVPTSGGACHEIVIFSPYTGTLTGACAGMCLIIAALP